jgi:hypothetical protein
VKFVSFLANLVYVLGKHTKYMCCRVPKAFNIAEKQQLLLKADLYSRVILIFEFTDINTSNKNADCCHERGVVTVIKIATFGQF